MATEIQYLLHALGISAKYRGYHYLAEGIALCLADQDYLLRVSKTLYPAIARTFRVKPCSVERDIRTVIAVCWEHGNRDLLTALSVCPLLQRPTNSQFLDITSSHLKYRREFPAKLSV